MFICRITCATVPFATTNFVCNVAKVFCSQLPLHLEGWKTGDPPPLPPLLTLMGVYLWRGLKCVSRKLRCKAQPEGAAVGRDPAVEQGGP